MEVHPLLQQLMVDQVVVVVIILSQLVDKVIHLPYHPHKVILEEILIQVDLLLHLEVEEQEQQEQQHLDVTLVEQVELEVILQILFLDQQHLVMEHQDLLVQLDILPVVEEEVEE